MTYEFLDNKRSRTYREHGLDVNGETLFSDIADVKPYDNKQRNLAYRRLTAGIRYHRGEKLSHIQIGFRRGYEVNVRLVLQKLMLWAKRIFGNSIEYFRAEVWENDSSNVEWRVHVHMIWNAPYIKQPLLVEKIQKYAGDSVNVWIRLIKDELDEKRQARYLMQYVVNRQQGRVYFSKSTRWLPQGYDGVWKELKQEFYQYVPLGIRKPLESHDDFIQLASHRSSEWRKAGLIDNMNAWIDEQRFAEEQHAEVKSWQKS